MPALFFALRASHSATAAAAFLLAGTFIGAEWSSKNLIAWLFWEPRRLRLMAAKFLALLNVPLEEREFSALAPGNRLKAGVALPPPAGVFPRYVEPEADGEAKPAPKAKPPKSAPKPGA